MHLYFEPRNDFPTIQTGAGQGAGAFLINENTFMKLDGTTKSVTQSFEDRHYVKRSHESGFELWRLNENRHNSSAFSGYLDVQEEFLQGSGGFRYEERQYHDIRHGSQGSNPRFFVEFNNILWFQANDGVHGAELWRDGGSSAKADQVDASTDLYITRNGTAQIVLQQFMDLMPGESGSDPQYMTVMGSYMYFGASGVDTSWMLPPSREDECKGFRQSSFDPEVYFAVAETTTWEPDRVYDCPTGYHWATTAEGHQRFTSYQLISTIRQWHSQAKRPEAGGSEGDARVGGQEYSQKSDFEYEKATNVHNFYEEKVYYDECGWDGYTHGAATRRYFRFRDSHVTGEYKHAGKPDSYRPDVDTSQNGGSLITNDFAGIVCIKGDNPACRGHECIDKVSGHELWRTDGTVEGTSRLDDIFPGATGSMPSDLIAGPGNFLYFAATNDRDGRELWKTDGTSYQSATMVSIPGTTTGINPGAASSNPKYMTSVPDTMSPTYSYVFMQATNNYWGRELWVDRYTHSDGSTELYYIDINTGDQDSSPEYFCSSGGVLPIYFSAYDSGSGRELWKSDGTAAGTSMVKDINPNGNSNPKYLTWFKNKLYFQADDGKSLLPCRLLRSSFLQRVFHDRLTSSLLLFSSLSLLLSFSCTRILCILITITTRHLRR